VKGEKVKGGRQKGAGSVVSGGSDNQEGAGGMMHYFLARGPGKQAPNASFSMASHDGEIDLVILEKGENPVGAVGMFDEVGLDAMGIDGAEIGLEKVVEVLMELFFVEGHVLGIDDLLEAIADAPGVDPGRVMDVHDVEPGIVDAGELVRGLKGEGGGFREIDAGGDAPGWQVAPVAGEQHGDRRKVDAFGGDEARALNIVRITTKAEYEQVCAEFIDGGNDLVAGVADRDELFGGKRCGDDFLDKGLEVGLEPIEDVLRGGVIEIVKGLDHFRGDGADDGEFTVTSFGDATGLGEGFSGVIG
jgi:hypothetical protein